MCVFLCGVCALGCASLHLSQSTLHVKSHSVQHGTEEYTCTCTLWCFEAPLGEMQEMRCSFGGTLVRS